MSELFSAYSELAIIVLAYMTAWFGVAVIKKRNDVADIAWGIGFFVVVLSAYLPGGFAIDRGLLVLILVTIWATRLSTHIYLRNRNKKEDYRYEAWRKEWGDQFYIRTYLQVFLLQGFFLFLVSAPATLSALSRGTNWNTLDLLGFAIWIFGFFFEAVGDRQLGQFIKNPENRGKLMRQGLWRYTRHPNYFGEVTQWWGLWIIALSLPFGWLSIIGPLTITFLILRVSGIPMLEANMKKNPEFEEYARETSIFFPLPPRT